jgi:hypothetical protein
MDTRNQIRLDQIQTGNTSLLGNQTLFETNLIQDLVSAKDTQRENIIPNL